MEWGTGGQPVCVFNTGYKLAGKLFQPDADELYKFTLNESNAMAWAYLKPNSGATEAEKQAQTLGIKNAQCPCDAGYEHKAPWLTADNVECNH